MEQAAITALAKGLVPYVRECVTEAFARTTVPPALAEQVKAAIHMLHESPPIIERTMAASRPPASPRVARIERDETGAFVPIYDDEPQP